jgi:hypothetical protein
MGKLWEIRRGKKDLVRCHRQIKVGGFVGRRNGLLNRQSGQHPGQGAVEWWNRRYHQGVKHRDRLDFDSGKGDI